MSHTCPQCNERYERLSMHWNRSQCTYPTFSDEQWETAVGLFMRDGDLHGRNGPNPFLRVRMTNERFVRYLDDLFGPLSRGVKLERDAETQYQNALANRAAGVPNFETVTEGAYSDLYGIRTWAHPRLNALRNWYDTGQKRYPDDLELTPTIARMWYVCDGWLAVEQSARPRAMFKVSNEMDRQDYLVDLFADAGFTVGFSREAIQIPADETQRLLDWMGDPPPGFEYKWDSKR